MRARRYLLGQDVRPQTNTLLEMTVDPKTG
jgi:hypothetical protein